MIEISEAITKSASWHEDVVFLLDPDLRFVICNPLWDKFAVENGGHSIAAAEMAGRKILDYVPDVLRQFYEQKYWLARREPTGTAFDYDCSSPEKIRLLRMSVVPMGGGFFISNRLRLEESCSAEGAINWAAYVSQGNFVTMCANCRKAKRLDLLDAWTWIPAFLNEVSLKISHGLCPRCIKHLYG